MKRKRDRDNAPPLFHDLWTERDWEEGDMPGTKVLVIGDGELAEKVVRLAEPKIDEFHQERRSHVCVLRPKFRIGNHRFAVLASHLFHPTTGEYMDWHCRVCACRPHDWNGMIDWLGCSMQAYALVAQNCLKDD